MPIHADPPSRMRLHEEASHGTRIKVISVGGGGSNAINRMIQLGVEGVEFISVNTDLQSLRSSKAQIQLQIGARLTHGLGAGADPEIGREAALEASLEIIDVLKGADMVLITAGLGGGTGTGAAPVIASIAGRMGVLTLAIVTRPFEFEGKRRASQADRGLQELLDCVDTLIVIPNQKLLASAPDTGFFESFQVTDEVLRHAVQGISDIVTVPGFINRDLADIRMTMAGMGCAVMGTGVRAGPHRATEAALAAIASPLLEAGAIDGARGILMNITGSSSLRLSEVNEASTIIQTAAHNEANIIFGAVLDERLGDKIKVTVIATGFNQDSYDRAQQRLARLSNAGEPAADFENGSKHTPDSSRQYRAATVGHIDHDEIEPGQSNPALASAAEGVVRLPARQTLPAHVYLQDDADIFTGKPASGASPRPGVDDHKGFIDTLSPDIVTIDYEQNILAHINGPPFDMDVMDDNADPTRECEPLIHPEITRFRQAAMAAYSALSTSGTVSAALTVSEDASFSEIFASRLRLLDLEQMGSNDVLDKEESPDLEPKEPTSSRQRLEEKEEVESSSYANAIYSQKTPTEVSVQRQPSSGIFHASTVKDAIDPHRANAIALENISNAQPRKVDGAKIPTPDFNRRLNRKPDFSLGIKVI